MTSITIVKGIHLDVKPEHKVLSTRVSLTEGAVPK